VIRLGYTFGQYGRDRPGLFRDVIAQAKAAEDAGFDSVWMPGHLMQAPAVAIVEDPMLECYTALGALAAVTSKVRLGSFVGCPAYRSAALLGKIVTTLDVISEGRAIFGIGAGWYEREHEAYGFDLGRGGARFDRHGDAVGRDPSSICRTVLAMVIVRDTTVQASATSDLPRQPVAAAADLRDPEGGGRPLPQPLRGRRRRTRPVDDRGR
jgi:alkanesulfonate monooxygenase SsuD/methylene tetrahydromethanopterin reductase-like flavin-dependent oxidoreductase (luciferase family)